MKLGQVKNKADALKTETQLLNRFDYAWNKENNVARRHEDVLQKLSEFPSRNIQYPKFVKKLIYLSQKPVGIKIEASEKFPQGNYVKTNTDEENHSFFSQIFKFNRSQPRFVWDRNEADEEHNAICGVSLGGGSVCREPPVKGRKRCIQHRGMRINRPSLKLKTEVKSPAGTFNSRSDSSLVRKSQINNDVASYSNAQISSAYKHEGAQTQVFSESSVFNLQHNTICGVELGDGYLCTSQPVKGRVRCKKHKGLKINAIIRKSALDDHSNGNSVCGAITRSGSYCSSMVKGNTRCWQHSVEVSGSKETVGVCNNRNYGGSSIYGAPTRGGSYGGSSICGAPTQGGSYCRRTVKGGGRCWQH